MPVALHVAEPVEFTNSADEMTLNVVPVSPPSELGAPIAPVAPVAPSVTWRVEEPSALS